jgi:S-adenosylmethionine hydrolase
VNGIITLITDFGIADHYVSALKGVILNINPKAVLVDISHQVQPQNIAQAAFLLDSTWMYFPRGTIHLVVVDPGVGSQRRAILLEHQSTFFIAPDNSVLSYVLADEKQPTHYAPSNLPKLHKLGTGFKAISLSNRHFWRPFVSATFHGRDILAPVAAHLSLGVPIEEFGKPVSKLWSFPIPRPHQSQDSLIGHIIYIDSFGNLISDIHSADLPTGDIRVEVCGLQIDGLVQYYAQKDELVALIGSNDRLEIALHNGSAAAFTGANLGDEITVKLRTHV